MLKRVSRTAVLTTVAGALVGCLLVALVAAPAAESFERFPYRWKGSPAVVKYHSLLQAEGDKWALNQAISAWNRQNFKVNFKRVARGKAQVIVRRDSNFPCGAGFATTNWSGGYATGSTLFLGVCSNGERYIQAHVASHELGHVLALNHENDVCAQMNTSTTFGEPWTARPSRCAAPPSGNWRCRLVNRDDARGIKAIYGGSFQLDPEFCTLPASTLSSSSTAAPGPVRSTDLSDDVRLVKAR